MANPEQAVAGQTFNEITIKSDGTKNGTTIKVNGKEIDNLAVLNFTFWNDNYGPNVSLGFSTNDPDSKPGTLSTTQYFRLVPPENKADGAKGNIEKTAASISGLGPRGDEMRKFFAKHF